MRIRRSIVNKTIPGLIALSLAGMCRTTAQTKPDLGATTLPPAAKAEPQSSPKQTTVTAPACESAANTLHPGAHSVTLSWNASVPASAQPRDAVIGYIVYRSTKPHDATALPINVQRLTATTCVDTQVSTGETYYYVTRAVSASGALSGPSNEVRVQIPPAITSSIR